MIHRLETGRMTSKTWGELHAVSRASTGPDRHMKCLSGSTTSNVKSPAYVIRALLG